METLVKAGPVETLYMTVPRAEMRKLNKECEDLRNEVAQLKAQLFSMGVHQPVGKPRRQMAMS